MGEGLAVGAIGRAGGSAVELRRRAPVGGGPWAPAAPGGPGEQGARPVAEPGADGRVLPVVAPLAALLPGWRVAAGYDGGGHGSAGGHLADAGAARRGIGRRAPGSAWSAARTSGWSPRPRRGSRSSAWRWSRTPGRTWWRSPPRCSTGWTSWSVAGRVPHAGDRQRLAARARQRGAVLLPLGPWPGADVELACEQGRWRGVGAGEGDSRAAAHAARCACGCAGAVSLPRAAVPGC